MNKDFKPKRGELISVSFDGESWVERIFVEKTEYEFRCIYVDEYGNWVVEYDDWGEPILCLAEWRYAKPLKT